MIQLDPHIHYLYYLKYIIISFTVIYFNAIAIGPLFNYSTISALQVTETKLE